MKRFGKIITSLLVLGVLAALVFWYLRSSTRVLVFESHDPLRQGLSEADFKELLQIHRDCFWDTKKEQLRLYFMKYDALDSPSATRKAQAILDKLSPDQEKDFGSLVNVYMMRDRGQIIGMFNCHEEDQVTNGSMMVFNVCVRKDKRGQGYGNELMLHALDKCARPGRDITLTVYKDDTKVVNFYKGLEFEIISDLHDWDHLFPFFNKVLMKYVGNDLKTPLED